MIIKLIENNNRYIQYAELTHSAHFIFLFQNFAGRYNNMESMVMLRFLHLFHDGIIQYNKTSP